MDFLFSGGVAAGTALVVPAFPPLENILHKEATMAKENMTTCAACGQAIAKSSKTCPHCGAKNKKPWFKKWWVWLLAVLIVAAIGSASSGSSPKQPAVSGAISSPAPTGTGEAAGSNANAQMPDLELVDNAVGEERDNFSLYLTGTVRNNRDKDYSYAQITFNLYDAEGNQIGTAVDNINNFKAGGTWKFKAMALESVDAIAS